MPICIPDTLPATAYLEAEGIAVMHHLRATTQDIRPLRILFINLMPKKQETELHFLRLLGISPLQIKIDFLQMRTHQSKNTEVTHLEKFYAYFEDIKDNYYDAIIVTGAPVEHLEFEKVNYWSEIKTIFEWSKTHVFSSLHICWGAQARLYTDYAINKYTLPKKVFGVFEHVILPNDTPLTRGFCSQFLAPHSRHTTVDEAKIEQIEELDIIAKSNEVGSLILATKDIRKIFIIGHLEYDSNTLHQEYIRDKGKNPFVDMPIHYYPDDDETKQPQNQWVSTAHLFYHNWLNMVYQGTLYNLEELEEL